MNTTARCSIAILMASCFSAPGLAQSTHSDAPEEYIRLLTKEGKHKILQTAVRLFRSGDRQSPPIWLVGAIHIGDAGYYDRVETLLRSFDAVLYEGVRSHDELGDDPDALRALQTQGLMRLLEMHLWTFQKSTDRLPASFQEMVDAEEIFPAPARRVMQKSLVDFWGTPLQFELNDQTVTITSLGADKQAGGEDGAEDLTIDYTQNEFRKKVPPYLRMANAMDIEFQSACMWMLHPRWQNSDISSDQFFAQLSEAAPEDTIQNSMLESVLKQDNPLVNMALAMVESFSESNPMLQWRLKDLIVTTLASAEPSAVMSEETDKVLIDERNKIVVSDLQELLENDPTIRSVGILYGAGHMIDLEQRIRDELGYEPALGFWINAIDSNPADYTTSSPALSGE